MTSPYNLKDTLANKPAQDMTFVYLLKLNISDESLSKPFYIGSTKNIAKHFSRNKYADWHYETFGRPVTIEVLGTVHDDNVASAEKDLKTILVNGGCLILSKMITERKAETYARSKKPIFYDLDAWVEHYEINIKQKTSKPVKNMEVVSNFNTEDIIRQITFYDFLDTESLNLALTIARSFNNEEGSAKIIFEGIKNKTDSQRLQKQLNKIKFIWNPQYKLKPYSVNEFRLTKPVIAKIEASSKAKVLA